MGELLLSEERCKVVPAGVASGGRQCYSLFDKFFPTCGCSTTRGIITATPTCTQAQLNQINYLSTRSAAGNMSILTSAAAMDAPGRSPPAGAVGTGSRSAGTGRACRRRGSMFACWTTGSWRAVDRPVDGDRQRD